MNKVLSVNTTAFSVLWRKLRAALHAACSAFCGSFIDSQHVMGSDRDRQPRGSGGKGQLNNQG